MFWQAGPLESSMFDIFTFLCMRHKLVSGSPYAQKTLDLWVEEEAK